jgi:hypothetical protein
MKLSKITHLFVIGIFTSLYLLTSIISTWHVVDFFEMSNYLSMAICLAVAFEMGAAASLASIIVLDKMNKGIVWMLFILLTLFQMMGNVYYAYVHLENFTGWIELFGLQDYDIIMQKRVLAILSGAILPLVALGFIKALVDYIRPSDDKPVKENDEFDDIFNESKPKAKEETFVEDVIEPDVIEPEQEVAPVDTIEKSVEPVEPVEPSVETKEAQQETHENIIMIEPKVKHAEKAEKELPESDELQKTDNDIKTKKSVNKQSKQISERVVSPWPIKTTKINPKEKKK